MTWPPEAVRSLRRRLGYNQTEMADALGYTRYQSVSDLETGKIEASGPVARVLDHLDAHGDLVDRREGAPTSGADDA
jgi:DNA-binding XRE family transcriptional regulator